MHEMKRSEATFLHTTFGSNRFTCGGQWLEVCVLSIFTFLLLLVESS